MTEANWIKSSYDMKDVCPLFLREFDAKKRVEKAVLTISARGVYEARLNGQRVGNFVMAPGWTDYRYRIQAQKYDVTGMLKEKNRLTVLLADGWFAKWKRPKEERPPRDERAIIAEIKIDYSDGTEETVVTDERWAVSESGLRFCDLYDGIVFDARIEPDFRYRAEISEKNDRSVLCEQIGDFLTEHERIEAVRLIETPAGEKVIDFGVNLTGYPEITLDAKEGQRLSLSFGEVLNRDGNFYNANYRSAKARFEYICKKGKQTYKPGMTFYGFRYVRIDEYPGGEPDIRNFAAITLYSDMRRTGYIETSDPLLNRFFENVIRSQKGNFLDVPTDCPQRDERFGWTGDAQVFMRTATYNFDTRKFFLKWLGDMKLGQREDGRAHSIIPFNRNPRCSAAWGDAVTICPWQYYLTCGDKGILDMMFGPMKKWVDYVTGTTEKKNLWFGGTHFGDWLELSGGEDGSGPETRHDLIASAFYAHSTELVCKAGRVVGEDVSYYEKLRDGIVKAFRDEFGEDYRTQTEHVLALRFGLCSDKKKTARSLADMISSGGDRLTTGFVGTPYLLHVLSDNGYTDLAYKLLLRKEYPSWLYPVTRGATTVWEHWDGIKPNGDLRDPKMNSFNHYAYGSVADWMYGVCAGINTVEENPGFEKILFAPVPTDRIDSFSALIDTVKGRVFSSWRRDGGGIIYEIETPSPATAVIGGEKYELAPGKYEFRS